MSKILDFRKQIAEDNFNTWIKESYVEFVCHLLQNYPKLKQAMTDSDYEAIIAEGEELSGEIAMWLVPIRNKAQEAKNRRYRKRTSKVVKIKGE